MKVEYVNIPENLSVEIERLFFEYNAALSVCRFLMSQEGINDEMMQKYLDSVECKWVELEMAKGLANKTYPSIINANHYEFDFENHRIKYIAEEPLNG